MGALSELISSEYGGTYDARGTVLPVYVAPSRVISNNPDCVSTTIVNLGANDVYLSPEPGVSSTSGVFLSAGGGSMSIDVRSDLVLAGHEWYGVSPGGDSTLFVMRVVQYSKGR